MPNSVIQSFSKKSGKPASTVERMWNDIVNGVSKKMDTEDDAFYGTVVTQLKKKLGLDKKATNKKTSIISGPSAVSENFTQGLAASNIDYSNNVPGNGVYAPKFGTVKRKKKKKKIVKVESVILNSSVGSLKQEKVIPKKKELSEFDKWLLKYKDYA